MEDILNKVSSEIERIGEVADEKARRKMIDQLRDMQYALETPEDTMQRLIHQNLAMASIRVSMDLKIFNLLSESENPMTLDDLTEKSGADKILLGRFLRHQASLGIIKETGKDRFVSSRMTKNLAIPEIQAGIYFSNDVLGPSYQAVPEFLAERKYQNPTHLLDTPFHKAWKTDLPFWAWVHQHPREAAYFNLFMVAQRSSTKDCFSFLPIQDECQGWPASKPVFVDVGGGTGQQCNALKENFPTLPGKVILQDLPAVAAEAKVSEGIEVMAHDFFTPQPVKWAKYYYLRAIMHDHADDKCLEILRHLVDAMDHESTLLLDEIVVPNEDIGWWVTQTDLSMMVQFSATERTEEQWHQLLANADLKVQKITTYTIGFRLSIIAATKA